MATREQFPGLKRLIGINLYNRVIAFANAKTVKTPQPVLKEILSYTGGAEHHDSSAGIKDYIAEYNPDVIPYSTYEKMTTDYQIAAGLAMIKLPVGQMRWDISCKDEEVRTFIKHEVGRLFKELTNNMLTAIDYGFAPHEKVWKEVNDYSIGNDFVLKHGFVLKELRLVKPETVIINRYTRSQDFAGISQYGTGTIPEDKSFLFSLEVKYGNLYGTSRIKPSYEPWYWSHLIVAFCNRFHETYGQPPILAKAPPGVSNVGTNADGTPIKKQNVNIMQEIAESLQEHTAVTIPAAPEGEPQFSLEFLSTTQTGHEFLNYLRMLDAWKLRGMFVPETIIGQPYDTGGSYGLAKTHTETFMQSEENLVVSIVDAINKQIIPQLVQYNYGINAPKAEMIFSGFSSELRDFLQKLFNNMVLKGTAVPSANALAKELGVPGIVMDIMQEPIGSGSEETRGDPGVPKGTKDVEKEPFEPAESA